MALLLQQSVSIPLHCCETKKDEVGAAALDHCELRSKVTGGFGASFSALPEMALCAGCVRRAEVPSSDNGSVAGTKCFNTFALL